jgi:hypothetical protein
MQSSSERVWFDELDSSTSIKYKPIHPRSLLNKDNSNICPVQLSDNNLRYPSREHSEIPFYRPPLRKIFSLIPVDSKPVFCCSELF